jgi:hypothetical protein
LQSPDHRFAASRVVVTIVYRPHCSDANIPGEAGKSNQER